MPQRTDRRPWAHRPAYIRFCVWFALGCKNLTTVVLPDTVTEVSSEFLDECGRVEVRSGSTAVQAAASEHNAEVDSE